MDLQARQQLEEEIDGERQHEEQQSVLGDTTDRPVERRRLDQIAAVGRAFPRGRIDYSPRDADRRRTDRRGLPVRVEALRGYAGVLGKDAPAEARRPPGRAHRRVELLAGIE